MATMTVKQEVILEEIATLHAMNTKSDGRINEFILSS